MIAVAATLVKHVLYLQDPCSQAAGLHYIRTKDGAEVDFALSKDNELTHLIECKLADNSPRQALAGFAGKFPQAEAVQLVRDLRQEEFRAGIHIAHAADWLAALAA